MQSHEIFAGALVTWLHTPRGGYGYVIPVDAQVMWLNPQGTKARIEAKKKDGTPVMRTVDIKNLRWRKS